MPLPDLKRNGDLPTGVRRATLEETLARFGGGTRQRRLCAGRLRHVYDLARRTGHLHRLVVFGSFVTSKPEPNDVDVVLVMTDDFRLESCPPELVGLFDHATAQARFGASIFWTRPSVLISESLDEFVACWQTKRGGSRRGIVEVIE